MVLPCVWGSLRRLQKYVSFYCPSGHLKTGNTTQFENSRRYVAVKKQQSVLDLDLGLWENCGHKNSLDYCKQQTTKTTKVLDLDGTRFEVHLDCHFIVRLVHLKLICWKKVARKTSLLKILSFQLLHARPQMLNRLSRCWRSLVEVEMPIIAYQCGYSAV